MQRIKENTVNHDDELVEAFAKLTQDERQLLTCALAGNHPPRLTTLRVPVLRALARADHEDAR